MFCFPCLISMAVCYLQSWHCSWLLLLKHRHVIEISFVLWFSSHMWNCRTHKKGKKKKAPLVWVIVGKKACCTHLGEKNGILQWGTQGWHTLVPHRNALQEPHPTSNTLHHPKCSIHIWSACTPRLGTWWSEPSCCLHHLNSISVQKFLFLAHFWGVGNPFLVSLPPFLQHQDGHTVFQGLRAAYLPACAFWWEALLCSVKFR